MKGEILLRTFNQDTGDNSLPVVLRHLNVASLNLLKEMAVQKTQHHSQSESW